MGGVVCHSCLSAAAIQGVHRWLNRLDRLTRAHLEAVPHRGEGNDFTMATNKAIQEVGDEAGCSEGTAPKHSSPCTGD